MSNLGFNNRMESILKIKNETKKRQALIDFLETAYLDSEQDLIVREELGLEYYV